MQTFFEEETVAPAEGGGVTAATMDVFHIRRGKLAPDGEPGVARITSVRCMNAAPGGVNRVLIGNLKKKDARRRRSISYCSSFGFVNRRSEVVALAFDFADDGFALLLTFCVA